MPDPTFTAQEKAAMLEKAARGELTPADCQRYIAATRASFLAAAAKAPSPKAKAPAAKPTGDPDVIPDFF